jgi:hypothetical protein
MNKEFRAFCNQKGIRIRYTATDQHQQNGIAERTIRTLKDIVRELLMATTKKKIPSKYWPILIQTAAYIRNRRRLRKGKKTPYENWYRKLPDLSHIVTIGATGWYLLPKKASILESKTVPCQMLGYEGDRAHNYTILRLDTNKVTNANDVFFKEDHLHISTRDAVEEISRKRPRSPALSPEPQRKIYKRLDLPIAEISNLSSYPSVPSPAPRPAPKPLQGPLPQPLSRQNLEATPIGSSMPEISLGSPIPKGSPIPEIPQNRYNLRVRTTTDPTARYHLQAVTPKFQLAVSMLSFMLIAAEIEPRNHRQAKLDAQ